MTSIVLNSTTKKRLAPLEAQLPHALLLAGESGVGLATIAKYLAGQNIASFVEPTDSKEQVNHETGTISVATIRELYEQTRAKSLTPRIFIIDDADRMSLGAQAAFLKLLEEPTKHTHFILTSHTPQILLTTIRSRAQTVLIKPISETETNTFLDTLGVTDLKLRTQLVFLAGGLPAELTRLVRDEAYFGQRALVMADTRTFLTGSSYQKLLIVHAYYQNKLQALTLLDSALAVTKRSLAARPHDSLVGQLEKLLAARVKIEANCNIRLQLTALVVQ